jgi:peptidoglycan/xylan/chitin deacetylase (PgdA/CDA1 family)
VKTLLKNTLVPILASRPVCAIASRFVKPGIPIFMMHRMDSGKQPYTGMDPDHLRRCLEYLVKRNYRFISLEDLIKALRNDQPLPDKGVVFTVDDGFWDQAEIAAPVFLEYDCPATFFVITGMLDKSLWPWDVKASHLITSSNFEEIKITLGDQTYHLPLINEHDRFHARKIIRDALKELDNECMDDMLEELAVATGNVISAAPPDHHRPLTWDSARQLEKRGIRFAPHSITHRMLSRLNEDTAANEIIGSWERLQNELALPSPVFCYPTGRPIDYGQREINILKENGMIGAVSTTPACANVNNITDDYLYNLPRFPLPDSFNDFIQYSTWIERAKT